MLCFFWATWHFSSLQLDRENCLRATGGNDGWNLHVKCLIVEMFSQYLSKMLIAITSLELKYQDQSMADFIPRLSNCKDFTFHQRALYSINWIFEMASSYCLRPDLSRESPNYGFPTFFIPRILPLYHEFSQTSHHQIIRREINVSRAGGFYQPSTSILNFHACG